MTITETTNGRTYESFIAFGKPYHTLNDVVLRLGQLAYFNHQYGPSDDRVTEISAITDDLRTFAVKLGAKNPNAAVERALSTLRYVHGHVRSITLSLLEEMEIAVSNSNLHD